MKRIAVIGESPYDTNPLCKVWNQKYGKIGQFSVFLKRVEGSVFTSAQIVKLISGELKRSSTVYDLFVLVRDSDAPRSDRTQKLVIDKWRAKISTVIPKNVLLLNIQELESLILADTDIFNKIYKTKIKPVSNPELTASPKEFLTSQTKKGRKTFSVADNKELIPKLNYKEAYSKCQFYRDFIDELEPMLGVKKSDRSNFKA